MHLFRRILLFCLCHGLGLGNGLLLGGSGAILVAHKGEHECTSGLGHGAQVDGVGHHLRHGHLGLQHCLAVAGGVHAHDAAPALVQVTHDIAYIVIGHGDLQLADGLHQYGLGLGQGLLEGKARRQLEGNIGGVHGVVRTVGEGGLQEHHGVAGQHAGEAALAQALFNGREIVLRHGAAEHGLLKDHILLLALGLEGDDHVAELTAAAGLLLIAAPLLHLGADLLTVSNTGSRQLRLHAEAALELGAQDIDLDIAGAGNDGLVGLGVVGDMEGGILLIELVEAGAHLLHFLLDLGGNGPLIAGGGILDALQNHHVLGIAQGVAGLDPVHLADGADVAAADLLDFLALLALHAVQAAQLLGVAGGGVIQGHITGDLAANDLDHGELAILIGNGLEHDGGGGAVGIEGDLDVVAVVILGGLGGHIGGHGGQVQDGLQQGDVQPGLVFELTPVGGFALVQLVAGGIFNIHQDARQAHTVKVFGVLDEKRAAAATDKGRRARVLEPGQLHHQVLIIDHADRLQVALLPQGPGVAHAAASAGQAVLGGAASAVLELGAVGQEQGARPGGQHLVKAAVGGVDAVALRQGDAVAGDGRFFQGHAQGNADNSGCSSFALYGRIHVKRYHFIQLCF